MGGNLEVLCRHLDWQAQRPQLIGLFCNTSPEGRVALMGDGLATMYCTRILSQLALPNIYSVCIGRGGSFTET